MVLLTQSGVFIEESCDVIGMEFLRGKWVCYSRIMGDVVILTCVTHDALCVCVCAGGGDPVAVDARPSLQTLGQGSAPVPPPATQDGGRTVGGSPLKNHAGLNISAGNTILLWRV